MIHAGTSTMREHIASASPSGVLPETRTVSLTAMLMCVAGTEGTNQFSRISRRSSTTVVSRGAQPRPINASGSARNIEHAVGVSVRLADRHGGKHEQQYA
jgi:hypothetical protein